jgi:hypothetical protein
MKVSLRIPSLIEQAAYSTLRPFALQDDPDGFISAAEAFRGILPPGWPVSVWAEIRDEVESWDEDS